VLVFLVQAVLVLAPAAHAGEHQRPVVLVGMTGLRWNDVTQEETPALWQLAQEASLGDLAIRSVRRLACPADGWLAVSAGKRAADLPSEDGRCRTLQEPPPGGPVPGWADYRQAAEESTYGAVLGNLGATVEAGGMSAASFGPGAAIALAGFDGVPIGRHEALPTEPDELTSVVAGALSETDLVVLDLGAVRDPGKATTVRPLGTPGDVPADDLTRAEQVQAMDELVGAALDGIEASGRARTVIVASLADSGRAPRLQLAAAMGPAIVEGTPDFGGTLLGSRATRQDGIFQTTDLVPTILEALGLSGTVPPGTLVGAPIEAVAVGSDVAPFVAVRDIERHARAIQPLIPPFFLALVFVNLFFYLLVTIGLNGRLIARLRTRAPLNPDTVLHVLSVAGVSIAAIPVASYLANALPWWRIWIPGLALFGYLLGFIAAITALALLPRWGRSVTAPIAVVGGLTMAVLCYDAATGGKLQVSALMGAPPTVAGRFFGLNNQAFALLATSSVLVAVVASDPLVRRGQRRAAAVVIALIGAVVTVLDGTPGLGSDFGGPPVLVPGFILFTLMALGVRITLARVLGILAAGVVVVVGFSLLDWLRPPSQRTHLGRFIDTVLEGGLWDVIARKVDQNLANLGGTWLTVLALGGIALVAGVLARPIRSVANAPDAGPYSWLSGGAPLRLLGAASPMLGSGLTTLGVMLALGFALNDSGIVIPAIGVSLAVPLLVAVSAFWMRDMRTRPEAEPDVDLERAEPAVDAETVEPAVDAETAEPDVGIPGRASGSTTPARRIDLDR
jgi:hypothetical protein